MHFGCAISLNLRGGGLSAFGSLILLYKLSPMDIMICNKLGAVFPAAAGAFFSGRTNHPGLFWTCDKLGAQNDDLDFGRLDLHFGKLISSN